MFLKSAAHSFFDSNINNAYCTKDTAYFLHPSFPINLTLICAHAKIPVGIFPGCCC